MSEKAVQRWEEGAVPGSDQLAAICRATGVSPAWLLLGEGEMKPAKQLSPGDSEDSTAIMRQAAIAFEAVCNLMELAAPYADAASLPDPGELAEQLAQASLAIGERHRDVKADGGGKSAKKKTKKKRS